VVARQCDVPASTPTTIATEGQPMTFTGQLLHIHVADAGAPMRTVLEAQLIAGAGINGARYATGTGQYSKRPDIREVTLIEVEFPPDDGHLS
jgi:hypothetical protein